MSSDGGDRRLHRQLGQQRDADAGGDHLAQRLEAGGPEAAALGGAGELAHRRAPGRAGSDPPRAAARARRRAPTGRPARRAPASGWSAGTASTKSSSKSSSLRAAGRRATGRASTPTSSRPSRSRWSTTSVFSSTSSSSSFGNRAWSVRHHVGEQVRRRASGTARCGACPTRGPRPGGRCSRMLSASPRMTRARSTTCSPASVSRTWRGVALDELDAELASRAS